MFCRNCGKELPDNVPFCNYCGAKQEMENEQAGSPAPETAQKFQQYEAVQSSVMQKPKKGKKKKLILAIVGVVLIVLASIGRMAQSSLEDSTTDDSVSDNTVLEDTSESDSVEKQEEEKEDNPEYLKIFNDRNIVQAPTVMRGDSAAFAKVDENGTIKSVEFGYKDDVIFTVVQTVYIDVSDYSDSQKEVMETTMRERYADKDALDFVTITSNTGTNYLTFSIKAERLDEEDILRTAIEKRVITATSGSGLMSMSGTEGELLSSGYTMK